MNNRFILYLFFFFSLIIANAQAHKGNQKEIEKILKKARMFSSYVVNSDYENIKASYTKDAKIFPNNTKIISGLEGIYQYWKLPEGISITHHKIFPEEINIVDETAYDYGYYEGTTKNKKGEEVSWKGKYVIVWKLENEEWKMYLDIWNNVK